MPYKKMLGMALAGCLLASPLLAQNFKPFTALRVIRTERFDIIFPEESRRTAEALAVFADSTYERVSSLLGIEVAGRIPVTITPESDAFNGYTNSLPTPHIVLFDTPMDIEWTTFKNSLEGLFIHELSHAVSLSSRGPAFEFLHGIFGGWIMPTALTTPLFMAEGVTVSFESLEGFGRANDPLVKEKLAQAVHEGSFLTPFQSSGVYDRPPLGNAYYEYGGFFSVYLQRRFGMEKYGELWRAMGSRIPVSLFVDDHGFNRIFRDVYGLRLVDVWADFAATLAVDGLEENGAGIVVGGESLIRSMDSGGGRIFVLDRVSLSVDSYDPGGGRSRVIGTDATAYDIDVSEDGNRLIVSGYRYDGGLAKATSVEYDVPTGRPTGRSWDGLARPRYFRDGVVAVALDRRTNTLVYRNAAGSERALLRGNGDRIFSTPAPVDDDRVAFVVAERGVRSIGLYDFRTGSAFILRSDAADDAERWRYLRDLRFSEGKLLFSYDHDDRFYKLGMVELGPGEEYSAIFASRDFSGGVFAPTALGDSIYYRAAFSTWDALARYPEKFDAVTAFTADLRLEPWIAADPDRIEIELEPGTVREERAYFGLGYLNPFKFWLPVPLIRLNADTFRVDGGGILSYLSTPTDMNALLLSAGADAEAGMGYFDLIWRSYSFGPPAAVEVSDMIEFASGEGFDVPYRATRGRVQFTAARGIGGERARLTATPSAEAVWIAPRDEAASSAYGWKYLDGEYALGLSVGLSTFERLPWRLFGRGISASFFPRLALPSSEPRYEGVIRVASELLRTTLYGAWDEGGQELDGHTSRYGDAGFADAAAKEYAREAKDGHRWVGGGELEFRAFSIDLQENVSHVYFNRLFGIVAWRGAAYEELEGATESPGIDFGEARFVHSLVVKTGAVVSGVPVAMVPIRFSPYFWTAVKLSSLGDGDSGNDFDLGFALSVEW